MTYQTKSAAMDYLFEAGFNYNAKSELFTKKSFIENWEGRRNATAIAYVKQHRVDPSYNKPDFYTVEFL